MNILETIVAHKQKEVEERKQLRSISDLEKSVYFEKPKISLKKFLTDPHKTGIIAEFKRKSPSKGVINDKVTVTQVVTGYESAGASAVSVLTDAAFFGGADKDLSEARVAIHLPILRKDFIIEEYQIIEAKSLGANVILLIAAVLEAEKIKQLSTFAQSIGLEVLLEIHNQEELFENTFDSIDVIGVNNRNLKDFSVSIQTSLKLAEIIPSHYLKISESGISNTDSILILKRHGFNGFLIGENFMKTENPGNALREFVREVHLKSETERKS